MDETKREELKKACRKEKDPMAAARMLAVHMVYVRKAGIDEGSFELLGPGRLSATSAILSTPADLASCSDADLPHLQIAATA